MFIYRELSSLEGDLGYSAKTLYAVSNNLGKHYRTVEIPKKSGGVRKLSVPDECLKAIQRRIAEVLLPWMPVSEYARAYRDCASTLKNAAPHVGRPLILKLDIYRFFDSIRYSDVKDRVFPAEIYAEPLRILLAMLCYHGDALPQGAPTSPAISNILMYDFDESVGIWCRKRGIAYTRYCDDLTFSGDFDPKEVEARIRQDLKKLGFLLNGQKRRIQRRGQQQSVTGIVVNEKPNLPASCRKQLRQALYYCQKFGIADHMAKAGISLPEKAYLHQLLGKVSYALSVVPGDREMQGYRRWLQEALSSL